MYKMKKEIVQQLLAKGILVTPELISLINEEQFTLDRFDDVMNRTLSINADMRREILSLLKNKPTKAERKKEYKPQEHPPKKEIAFSLPPLDIEFNYIKEQTKKGVKDFVAYFQHRFDFIRDLLSNRPELSAVVALRTLLKKRERETVSIIAMVSNISETKNGNLVLDMEDQTGKIRVIITKSKPDLFDQAKNLVLDEVLGITGTFTGEIIFATSIVLPEIPLMKEQNNFSEETYALFFGDIHVGSKYFMNNQWEKLISWIKGEYGNEKQKQIARKTKYIFMMGDNVEGIGIYPNQVQDLSIKDIYEQYKKFEDYVLELPKDKRIVIIPGNHDASRLSEPQPPIEKKYCPRLYEEKHISFTSSPSYVRIGKSDVFSGLSILLYHGYSFPYYGENVESIRSAGGLERVDKIMSFLLQKRHLAPSHTSTLYIPENKDNLIINPVPDIFASGHVHRTTVSSYRGTITINASSWIEETDYQKKVGLIPEPGKAILVGLHNREVKILNFN